LAVGIVLLAALPAQAADPAAIVLGEDGDSSALKPMAMGVLEAAPVVRLGGDFTWGGLDPLTCLAQAVYFEARSESEAGQEAVAQVVLNRTHLAQYAPSVCGVVYQGAERTSGCQFTFVCDGSPRAPDDTDAWGRAVEVAKRALAGFVYKPMLGATHYHAAWMTPYWAPSLTRIRRIGGQIFYH
jgi:hypothetical protein